MKYCKKIESENLYLSPMRMEDAEKYCEWINDKDVSEGVNATKDVISLPDEIEYLEGFRQSNNLFFSIVKKDNDELIGSCSYTHIDHMAQCAEIGIMIGDKNSRGKGYGQETMKMLVDFGFNSLNFHSIYLTVYPFNEAALACYKKIGFKEVGRRREAAYHFGKRCDIIFMDILKDEFIC